MIGTSWGISPERERNVHLMQKNTNLQDLLLTRARLERRNVTLFLMNGFQLRGQIVGFDPFVVVVNTDGKQLTPPPP